MIAESFSKDRQTAQDTTGPFPLQARLKGVGIGNVLVANILGVTAVELTKELGSTAVEVTNKVTNELFGGTAIEPIKELGATAIEPIKELGATAVGIKIRFGVGNSVAVTNILKTTLTLGALYAGYKLFIPSIVETVKTIIGFGGERNDQEVREIEPEWRH